MNSAAHLLPPPRGRPWLWRRLLQAAVLFLLAGTGHADESLNEALVPVPDTSKAARTEALPRALAQVFSKWSGQRALSGPAVSAELARSAEFVQQYRYRRGSGKTPHLLWVRFEAQPVADAMQRAGVAVWGAQRPSPLVWVARREDGETELVGPDSEDGLDRVLSDAAWIRGLPLRLPLLDLEDRIRARPEDIWAMDPAVLTEASARYPAGPVVAARLSRDQGGPWQASWWMLDAGKTERWQTRGAEPGMALAEGVNELADRLVTRYALASTAMEAVEITVSGIRSLVDYARLMNYLQGLGGVRDVAVLETRGESMRFRMQVPGGDDGLRRIAALGGVLIAGDAPSDYRLGP